MKLRPKHWDTFQHYKNRRPPWIKLHRSLLDDVDFSCLPTASRALAPMLWLIASESEDGVFDGSVRTLAFRLRTTQEAIEDALVPLIESGWFEVLAGCQQDASNLLDQRQRERERQSTETEERRGDARAQGAAPPTNGSPKKSKKTAARPEEVPESLWDDFMLLRDKKRAPFTDGALTLLRTHCGRLNLSLVEAMEICINRGWTSVDSKWGSLASKTNGTPRRTARDRDRGTFLDPDARIDTSMTEL